MVSKLAKEVLKVGEISFIIHPVPSFMQCVVKAPILLQPIFEKKSAVPAPVENLLPIYEHT